MTSINAVFGLFASILLAILPTYGAQAQTIYTASGSTLLKFSAESPSVVTSTTVTGLWDGGTIFGLDRQTSTGQIVAWSGYNPGYGQLFLINPDSGVATGIPGTLFTSAAASSIDCDPTTAVVRLIFNDGHNCRIDPGADLIYDYQSDLNPAGNIVAIAYLPNDVASPTAATLFGIDSTSDTLVRIGGPNGSPSPDLGAVTTIGALGVDIDSVVAMDHNGTKLYALLRVDGVTSLYRISTTTGHATPIGLLGGNPGVFAGLAVLPSQPVLSSDLQMGIKLNFGKPASDSIKFMVSISVVPAFNAENKPLNLDVGGVVASFMLDSRGKGKSGNSKVSVKVKDQIATIKVTMTKGDFQAALADEGLGSLDITGASVNIPVVIDVEGESNMATTLSYSKNGIIGKAK